MTDFRSPVARALLGSSILACLAVTAAGAQTAPAPAEPAAPAAAPTGTGTGIADIVVTAQRRNESVQKTPIAITAFTSGTLRARGIENPTELAAQTPSFSVRGDAGIPSFAVFSIRGLGQNSSQLLYQPAVAVYEDGVYAATSAGALVNSGFYDVQRVEVLKGPQGTLFGRNSTGGAISILSNLPSGRFEGEGQAYGGSNGLMGFNGFVNVPISGDDVGLRVVGQYAHSDGYGRDVTSGTKLNTQNVKAVRGTFRAKSGPFQIVLRGDYTHSTPGNATQKITNLVPGSPLVLEAAFESGLAHSFADLTPAVLQQAYDAVINAAPANRYDVRYSPTFVPRNSDIEYGGSATLSYDLTDNIQAKSISAYRRALRRYQIDNEGTPFTAVEGDVADILVKQYTQEFQLNGSALDNKLKFATGLYYFRVNGADELLGATIPFLNPSSPIHNINRQIDTSKSAYGQVTYTLLPGLNLTGGVRYTDETIHLNPTNTVGAGGVTDAVCAIPAANQVPGSFCLAHYKVHFTNWSWTGGLDYQVTPNILVYGKASRGFKAGGYNSGPNELSTGPFKPEIATTYEVGVKSEFFDHHLRLNGALYQTDFKNIQRLVLFADATGNVGNLVLNAASARIRGAELEATVTPLARVELNGGLAYTDPKYLHYVIPGGADRSFERFPNVPKWQLNFAASYTAPLPIGSLRFGVDGSYQSYVQYDPSDLNPLSDGAASQPAYTLVNGRVTLKTDRDSLDIEAFVSNIFNKHYDVAGVDLTQSLGYAWASPGAPRMWGLKVTKRF